MKFRLYDVVRLKSIKQGVAAGAEGTIVMTYEFPKEGYEVEFSEHDQEALFVTLDPDELDLVVSWDGSAAK